MAAQNNLPPIIIKKVKKGSHDAHSSAWKIALADFMTTLMCFFLVMWLTSITNTDVSKDVSRFLVGGGVDPSEPGIGGLLGGQTITVDGSAAEMSAAFSMLPSMGAREESDIETLGVYGLSDDAMLMGQDGLITYDDGTGYGAAPDAQGLGAVDLQLFEALAELKDVLPSTGEGGEPRLRLVRTPRSLRIDLLDTYKHPMFTLGGHTLLPGAKEVLRHVAKKLRNWNHPITITGHTDDRKYHSATYTNWELSTDRANATRRFLKGAAPTLSIDAVIGKSTKDDTIRDGYAPSNRRISLEVHLPTGTQDPLQNQDPFAQPSVQSASYLQQEQPAPPLPSKYHGEEKFII